MKKQIQILLILISGSFLSACGGEDSVSAESSMAEARTRQATPELPQSIAGTFGDEPVELKYGVAIPFSNGQVIFNFELDPPPGYTMAVILSDQPISCDTDFSGAPTGFNMASLYKGGGVSSTSDNIMFSSDGQSVVYTPGDPNAVHIGTLSGVREGLVSGYFSYTNLETGDSLEGKFSVLSCL